MPNLGYRRVAPPRFKPLYRSHEEIRARSTNETSDVYVLGSYYYTLLNGLKAFYHIGSTGQALEQVTSRHKPFINDRYRRRSLIEGRLVEIMEQMYEYETFHHSSIFQVIKHLRATVRSKSQTSYEFLTSHLIDSLCRDCEL